MVALLVVAHRCGHRDQGDSPNPTLAEMRARARRLKQRNDLKPRFDA